MIWDFIYGIYEFFIDLFEVCEVLWTYNFNVGDYVIQFKDILTGSLILVIGLLLIKKLIPVA